MMPIIFVAILTLPVDLWPQGGWGKRFSPEDAYELGQLSALLDQEENIPQYVDYESVTETGENGAEEKRAWKSLNGGSWGKRTNWSNFRGMPDIEVYRQNKHGHVHVMFPILKSGIYIAPYTKVLRKKIIYLVSAYARLTTFWNLLEGAVVIL